MLKPDKKWVAKLQGCSLCHFFRLHTIFSNNSALCWVRAINVQI